LRKFKFHQSLTRKTSTLHEDEYTLLIMSHSVLIAMRNVSDNICRENGSTHFMCGIVFSKIVPFTR